VALMLMMESTSIGYRSIFSILFFGNAPVANLIVPPLMEHYKDWKIVGGIFAACAMLFSVTIIFLVESPRFYRAQCMSHREIESIRFIR